MKKSIALILALLMVFSLAACGSNEDTGSTPDAGNSYTISIAHACSEDSTAHIASVGFKDDIEAATNGRITVEIFPNGLMGGDFDCCELVASGSVTACAPAISVLANYHDEIGILDLPFIFSSEEESDAALNHGGELGAYLSDLCADVNLKILNYSYGGKRNMTNNIQPINTPADLAPIKMRVMESPVFLRMFELLDCNATPMSFSELYTGLQQGTVDGQENSNSTIYDSKFFEVQKYLSVTEHCYSFGGFVINNDFFNSLSAEDQALISEISSKWYGDEHLRIEKEKEENYLSKLENEEGMIVNTVSPENHQKFVEAVEPMYEEYKAAWGEKVFSILDACKK